MMNWAKPKRDETKKSGWAKGISIDEGKNITLPLATTDGQKFGDVSYNAYKAIENNTIDSYQPMSDTEKSTIDKYKNYIVTKATELQNKKLEEYKQNPTFIKYGIDPLEFDMKAFEKWADEHNFVYSTQADTWIPKREGDFLNIWGTGGRNLATEEDMNELPKLQTLAGQNERLKKADGKSAGFLSFIDSVSLGLIPKLTDLIEEELYPTAGLNDYILDDRRVKMTDYIAQAKQDQPVAGTIGSVAGALVPLAGVGGAVAKATKGVKWIASTPKWVQGAINSGITFSVISGTETGIKGGTPEEILRNAGINLVGGAVGSSLSGIVGGIGQKILFDKSLQHKVIPEIIRSGISSTAFAGGKTLSTYWLYPDEYKPSAQQITQDLLTAFAFGAINSAINVSKMSRQNKTYLDNLYKKMSADYENMARANVSSKSDVTGIKRFASNVIEYTKQMEAYLTGKGYKSIIDGKEYSFSPNKIRLVGQDKYVKSILNDLNTIKTHANAVLNGMPTGTTDVATTTPPATGAIAPTSNVATPAAETVSPPPIVNAPTVSQPITNEFDELMATDISDVKPGDVYIKKDTGNKITVVDETDKAVKIEVDTGKSTTVRDISISQAERLKGDEFEKQPTAVNEMALQPETPITADEVIPEQTDTSSGEVITLSTPKNKKDFSINTKQYNLFKNAKKIVIGNDIITDGYIAVVKTEEVLGDINKLDNANVTSNDKMSLGKFYDGSNNVVLSGDPKLYEREVEEQVDGTKTGKKILQKSYVFKVGDKLYGVQQKYLDAFNNGRNTFVANETNPTRPIAVMDGENLVGIIMPVRVDHLQDSFDSLTNASVQIAETKAAAQAKKAEIESRPVDNKTLKEFMEWSNIQYYEADDGKMFVTNGHFLMTTDRNGIDYIVQQNNERNPHRSKIEAVKNENLRKYIENHNATYELTEQPILQENTYIYTDDSKYFGYNKRYVDMFKKDGNRFFVNTTTDNLNDQFLVVKNTSDEVVGIIMPLKLSDDIADVLKDKLPIDVATPKQTEKPIIPDTEKENVTVEKMKHSKTGEDIWVVRMKERVEKDKFNAIRTKVKGEGGYWSNFIPDKKGGGFIFKSEPTTEQLERAFDEVAVQPTEDVKSTPEVLKTEVESDIIKETKPDLQIGDIIEMDGKQWRVTQTGLNMSFENLDKSDKQVSFSHIGGMDNFKDTHDYAIIKDGAITEAKKPVTTIADFVKSKLAKGEKISSNELFVESTKAFGDTMANNAFTSKDAYDAMELGVNQFILSQDNISAEGMLKILELLPTQTKRTEGMDKFQQFSTPPSIAYLANWVANVNNGDIMLEPSAGIGGIAVFAKKDGATVYVNELDPRRLEILKNMPFDGFYNEDAEQINNILGGTIEPTVIVMNPPFSSSSERNIQNTKIGAKHIEEALKILAPNGRLVAIVGQGMSDSAPAFRDWWKKIKSEYNVLANVGIDGKNYRKYGTNFGIQMLVIDKNGASTVPTKTDFVENLSDLQEILRGFRDVRPNVQVKDDKGTEPRAVTAARKEPVESGKHGNVRERTVSDTSGTRDTGLDRDRPKQTDKPKVDTVDRGLTQQTPTASSDVVEGATSDDVARGITRDSAGASIKEASRRTGTTVDRQPTRRSKPRVKKELTDSIFERYVPQPLLIKNAQSHPANISESAAMSAIEPPPITYKPNLPQSIIDNGVLSDVQLEAVTYAGQSHSQTLPNKHTRGFFLGDGTGVGKGRTITGIILDNYNQGRKRAIWVSENKGLLPDAKRDVKALFGDSSLVMPFEGGKKADVSLSNDEGLLFVTYSALSRGFDNKGSSFEKIVNWFGKDFDGVIVFDEAHNMANSTATKGTRGIKKASQRGLAGIALQEALPKAKIVYSSATGATEVENLRYADRLGLWGEGTAFPNGDDFVSKIKAGGLAAMELIARDMKAMGVYLSRNISYDDVTYDRLVHKLTKEQRTIYDELARSWQIVFQNIEKALEATNQNKDGRAKGEAYGAFWSAEQRFFNQILTAMQVPTMITDIQKQLDSGNSAVIQLVSTNESAQEKEFARLQDEGLELEDFDVTPKQMLMSFIEHSFPVIQFEEYKDDKGNVKSRPVYDSKGNAVINRDAVRQRDELLNKLGSIKVPASPLDMIINHFGTDLVAENTGRKRRVVKKDGKVIEENIANKKEADVSAFQNGDKRIIVFSKAGGTGKSYHADKSAKNQQHRVHYLLQAGWQADSAVQGFGRSHRSNQVSAPSFKLITTDLKGQMRFISTIAKRLDQLGALTKGQRQTGSQGMFSASDNLENSFAADVLSVFYKDLVLNRVEGVSDGMSIVKKLGLSDRIIDEYGQIIPTAPELREVNKFLNRILSLESHEQNTVFDGYSERLQVATEKALQDGTLDKGLENYKADKITVNEVKDIRDDENTGAKTKYYSLTAEHKMKPITFDEINSSDKNFVGFFQNKNTGTVRAVFKTSSTTDQYGNIHDNYRLTGQTKREYLPQRAFVGKWNKLEVADAKKLWNEEIANLPEFRKENLHLISGVVLPVWDKLPTENVRIYRVLTDKGEMLIGRVVPENMIDETLRRLGSNRTREKIATTDLIKGIKNGDIVHLENDWRIKQSKVSGENRIEIIGPDFNVFDLLKDKGVFTERISYSTRFFVPTETNTKQIIDEVLKISPVLRVETKSYSLESEGDTDVRNLYSDGNIGRQAGTDTAQQVKSVARGSREVSKTKGASATDRRIYAENAKANGQIENKRKFSVQADFFKREGYNEYMNEITAKNEEYGIKTEFISGNGKVMFANGQKNIRGVYIPKEKTVIIQYDHPEYSPTQINRHEIIHKNFGTKEVQKIKNIIANSLSIREKNRIIKELYRNYYNITGGNEEIVFEEFIADVLSGMNDYSTDFEHLANAYWSGSEIVDIYSPATYAELIDTGDVVDTIGFGEISYSFNDGIGWHKGDLGKAESFASQYGSARGTGHFGTGTYFVGENKEGDFARFGKDRPTHSVDFSKYNLFTPMNHRAGMELHNALKAINDIHLDRYDGKVKYNGTEYAEQFFVDSILYGALNSGKDRVSESKIRTAFKNTMEHIKKTAKLPISLQQGHDSASTYFMKQLGFEGVDVRHISQLDNTEFGSVIYDVKDSDQTTTPEFKNWFGDSKVVNKEGKPLVVYHGTPVNLSNIDVMKKDYRGTIWVTPQANHADRYSGMTDNMLELYAKVENPYIENIPYGKEWDIDEIVHKAKVGKHDGLIINVGIPKFLKDKELHYKIGKGITAKEYFNSMNPSVAELAFEGEGIPAFLERIGDTLYTNIAVFSPSQLKSAADNIGTFDPYNPDIRYSLDNDIEELTPERIKEIKDQFEKDRVGVIKPSQKEVWGERWRWIAHNMTRVFPDIPERGEKGTFFAEFRKMMVQWNGLSRTAQFMTQDKLNRMTEGLSPKEFRTFSELVYFLDLQEEANIQIERGYDEILLPNEISPKEVNEIIKVLNTEATPKVMDALQKRQYIWKDLKEKYVALNQLIGFDTENRFLRENYYRHQVIEHMTKKEGVYSGGKGVEIKAGRGWLKQRQGSTKAINTDFLAVEYQAMLQMQYDTYIANTWAKIGEQYDIKPQLEKQAFRNNRQFLDDIIASEAKAKGKDGSPAMIMRNGRLVPDSETYEQQQWFNKRIMFGFSGLYDLAERNELPSFDGEYNNVIKTLRNKNLNGVPQSVLYKYVGVIAGLDLDESATDGEKQAVMNARTVLKYTSQKRAWIKDLLGKNYQTWESLANEKSDAYGVVQPRRGNYFFTKTVVDEGAFNQSLNEMITNLIDGQGIEMTSDVKALFEQYSDTVRLTGAAYQQMVLPNEIIKTMELVGNPKQVSEGAKAFRGLTTAWKGWATSVNPLRTVKFGIRNLAGDLDAVIAGKPQVVKYTKRAMTEIYNAMRHKKYSTEFMEWTERGGYSSMIFANEMDTEMQDKLFAHLKDKSGKSIFNIPGKLIEGYYDGVEAAHNFREAILRYSAYLYFKDTLTKSDGVVKDNVASNRFILRGLKTIEDKAYQLSKDLLGAYDEVNKMGQTLRRYWIPFYSFTETNLKRYYRMFENIITSDDNIGKKTGKLLLKALMVNLLGLIIIAWNKLVMTDDEEKLPPSVKVRPHITLGSIGDNVYAFTRLGSFTELLEWFGLDDYRFDEGDLLAPVDKAWGMITPFAKIPIEIASGLNFYPELTKPRAIRDKWEHFFNSWGVADVYKHAAGKPTRGIGNTIENMFLYKYDYKESAYYEIQDRKREFQGRGDSNIIYGVDDKSNALYYMKLAVRYNDKKAALKYLEQYFENGGTGRGIIQSFSTLNPMYGFTGKDTMKKGEQFVKSLDDSEKQKLKIAQQYYEDELMLPDNVTALLKRKNITDTEAKNVLKKYINSKIK